MSAHPLEVSFPGRLNVRSAPNLEVTPRPLRVDWNSDLQRYQAFINNGNLIAYTESPDGLTWSVPTVLKDFSDDPNHPGFYVTPVGPGDDPNIAEVGHHCR